MSLLEESVLESRNFSKDSEKEVQWDLMKHRRRQSSTQTAHVLYWQARDRGKTLTIVNRVKYLIEKQKVRPEEILVVTLQDFAAAEMKSRLCLVMGKRDLPVTVGTFHGIYYGILKWAYRMNQENILSETEKYQILRGVINKERMEIFDEEDFIQDIVAEIGKVKNNRIPLEEFVSEKCSADAFRNIYRNYERHRKELKKRLILMICWYFVMNCSVQDQMYLHSGRRNSDTF